MKSLAEYEAELRAEYAGTKAAGKLELVAFDDIELDDDPEFLIQGIIPAKGLTVVWGPPKTRKSFGVFDMLMHSALDREYRGRTVLGGPSVYCAFEGAAGFKKRLIAFRRRKLNGHDGRVPFYVLPVRINLAVQVDELVEAIKVKLNGERPLSITLDTLNRSLVGSESKDEDMSAYIAAADRLRQEFDCAVIIIHHCGVDGSRPRGHTSLTGACDCQISVVRRDELTIMTVEYMKDGDEGETIAFKLEQVVIGQDKWGADITSCVVVEAEAPSGSSPAREPTLPVGAKMALNLLRKALDECGETPPAHAAIPNHTRAVRVSCWRSYCDIGQIAETDKPDTKLKAFKRAGDKLQALGFIGVWADWVWIKQ
jgi:hypothetical protein